MMNSMGARRVHIEVDTLVEGVDFDGCLGSRRKGCIWNTHKQCEDDEQHGGLKSTSEGSAEVNTLEEQVSFDGCLSAEERVHLERSQAVGDDEQHGV